MTKTLADMDCVLTIWSGEVDDQMQRNIDATNRHSKSVYLLRVDCSGYPPGLRRDLIRKTVDVEALDDGAHEAFEDLLEAMAADKRNPNRN